MRILNTLFTVTTLAFGASAAAHAVVRTELGATESALGATEMYRLQVPNESAATSATTQVRMLLPAGFVLSRTLQAPGWKRTFEKDAAGKITAVVWTGRIEPQEIARFYFQGANPKEAAQLTWKVYQKYADNTVTAWDDANKDFPASSTTVK
ncbi:hypothetical protein GCM10008955_30570 [Deinococcus malanensis]|uniref:YncI copper-binding domain-containing protein n=1 Tax=Deinococcus malanensis TaxID=1706855 RepID=A0ABQ2EZ10_9DEIO|nr:DUF1775 domain-containing protein [Deinococcus malanensis]GGK34440.1 hypothetical protein GCM10008955_30570 [Deinococcus malanensis]